MSTNMIQLPRENQASRRFRWGAFIGVFLAVLLAICAGVFIFAPERLESVPGRNPVPKPVVVTQSGSDGVAQWDYYLWVKATVRNDGGSGRVVIRGYASIDSGKTWWSRQKTVDMRAGDTVDVEFRFYEASILDLSLSFLYRVEAV